MIGLFARNFDAEDQSEAANADRLGQSEPACLPLAEAEMLIEKARSEAYRQGQFDGAEAALTKERASRAARSDHSLEGMGDTLKMLVARDRKLRSEVELEVAELLFGIGERILPDLFNSHMPDILVSRIHSAVRTMTGTGNVIFSVPEELSGELAPRIEALIEHTTEKNFSFSIVADSQIEDGTIRIDWRNGFLEFDPSYASLEILETLKEAIHEMRAQSERMDG